MKKLDLHIKDGLFPKSSGEIVFSTLLKVKDISDRVVIPPKRAQYRNVLKEIFSIINSILESCTSVELKAFDGLVPFVGPPRWPTVKSELMIHSSSPPFDFMLLAEMATFLTTGALIESNEDQDLVVETARLSRNLCLLGDDRTIGIFLSHINTVLHWIEIEASQTHFLSQTFGLISCRQFDQSSSHVPNIWRILRHKIQTSSDHVKARSLECSTAILVAILPLENNSEAFHMLSIHWDILELHAFAPTSTPLSPHALESIGSLGSLSLSFPRLMDQIKKSFVDIIGNFHSLILSRLNDPTILCPALQAFSRIISPETCSTGLTPFLTRSWFIDEFVKSWSLLTCTSALRSHSNRLVRFHLAESVVRLAITFDRTWGTDERRCQLLTLAETITSDSARGEAERGFAVLSLRVLLKQESSRSLEIFSTQFLYRMTVVFLTVIRGSKLENSSEKELFIQDICCAALCEIFQLSHSIETDQSPSHSLYSSLSEKISSLVISTLCREKRNLPSAGTIHSFSSALNLSGIAVAGESRELPVDTSRALESALPLPLPLTGNPDQLLAAVATATAELNIFNTDDIDLSTEQATDRNRTLAGDESYGIYTKVCKVAKKTGDPFVVFAVLGLIQRDPSYGLLGSDTELFYSRYKPPMIKIDKERVRKILPMLYLARYDPMTSIREIIRVLWSILIPTEQESALLSAHCDEILGELTSNLKSKQWKDRESACLALESFIPQRPWKKLRPSLLILWSYGMDVLDDIRDSTRSAALGFMKTLANQVTPSSTHRSSPLPPFSIRLFLLATQRDPQDPL